MCDAAKGPFYVTFGGLSGKVSASPHTSTTQETIMEIGFIGLGNMGQPMARRLIEAGHKLVIYDIKNDVVAPLLALGARLASSPADVADRVETVMVSLPDPPVVTKVVTDRKSVV